MVNLNFTFTPEAASKIHDLLVCFGKISESVAIEARADRFTFTALNSSKSTYALASFDGTQFFTSYECSDGRFTCSIYTKALLGVFKSRVHENLSKDCALDWWEGSVRDRDDETQCRFIFKMVCNRGIIKTHKLTYEAVDVMHALFDRNMATNRWTIDSSAMKEYMDFFGPKTEMLDIFMGENDTIVFKSYTEKIVSGKEILKQPLSTTVEVPHTDFERVEIDKGLHIIISVKDFKAIVAHAETLKTSMKAFYSRPMRPLQFGYSSLGIACEFTLMTTGRLDSNYEAATPVPRSQTNREPSRNKPTAASESFEGRSMPPPTEPASRRTIRRQVGMRKAPSPKPSPDPESLFVQQEEEDDSRWEPVDYNNDEEALGWDASVDNNVDSFTTFRDSGSFSKAGTVAERTEIIEGIEPTQRVSQIKGLW